MRWWSGSQEVHDGGCKRCVVLEDTAVAGIGVDEELGTVDASVQVFGQCGGDHAVVVTVGDERGLGEFGEVGRGGSAVFPDCFQLRPECADADWLVAVPVRSSRRLMKPFAAALPLVLRLKNRNSLGSDLVTVARRISQ